MIKRKTNGIFRFSLSRSIEWYIVFDLISLKVFCWKMSYNENENKIAEKSFVSFSYRKVYTCNI